MLLQVIKTKQNALHNLFKAAVEGLELAEAKRSFFVQIASVFVENARVKLVQPFVLVEVRGCVAVGYAHLLGKVLALEEFAPVKLETKLARSKEYNHA